MELMKRTWAEIDLDALCHNCKEYERIANGTPIMGVIKADGYGHGDVPTARALYGCGVRFFGVSNLLEAISLRRGGVGGEILILGYTPPEDAKGLADYDITGTVYDMEYADLLDRAAAAAGVKIKCHVKIDTGMNRIGFSPDADAIAPVYALSNLALTGVFTHLCCADEDTQGGREFTAAQFQRFMATLDGLASKGIRVGVRHCCNTAAALRCPEMHLDMVRIGIGLYGLSPEQNAKNNPFLKPVMTLKSVVSMVKTAPAGGFVGYGATYELKKETKIATVPIGYADGYSRLLSSRGVMGVGGKLVRVIGRVCMDQVMLDVTGLDVNEGDEVVVFGPGGPSVDEVAAAVDTINYEIVCDVSRRVPRAYLRQGAVVLMKDYLL